MQDIARPFHAALVAIMMLPPAAGAQESGMPIRDRAPGDWTVEAVAEGLDYPWDLARSGDALFATEAAGNVLRIGEGGIQRHPVETSAPILRNGGGGLLGMAPAEDFAASGLAFFYHTYASGGGAANRVIEARFDGSAWIETRVLIDAIPGHRLYNGGRVAIGPEGHLYITTGWTEDRGRPQDPADLAGKILRITTDGGIPDDNPFPGSPVYSLGHRNPQGLAWDPDGALLAVEHGQSGHDEVNRIRAGGNYGWPLISGDETRNGMERPLVHSGTETWAPSGAAFAGEELLVATLVGRGLYVFDEAAGALRPVYEGRDRIRDILPVGDKVWLITTNRSPRGAGVSDDRLLLLSPRDDQAG